MRSIMNPATVKCPSCGILLDVDNPLPARARLQCPDCATIFRPPSGDKPASRNTERGKKEDKTSPKERKKSPPSRNPALLIVILAVLLLGLVGGAIALIYYFNKDETVAQNSTTPTFPGQHLPDGTAPTFKEPGDTR